MNYKLAQLLLTPGKNANSISEIFVAQIDNHKEFLAGKLFILLEIGKNDSASIKIANFLIDSLNHNYYQSEKILLREKISTLKVEHIFEAALAKTNKNFKDYLDNSKISISNKDINISAGVIHGDAIYLSSANKNKAFLIFPDTGDKKNTADNFSIATNYKIIDIIKQSGKKEKNQKTTEPDDKLFSDVISGEIPAQSYFFITNEALPEYLSKNQIIQTITILPPISAVEQIKQTLANINSYVSFAGLIIKGANFTSVSEKKQLPKTPNVRDSIVNLNQTEDTTEQLLAPSGIINVKKWLSLFFGWLGSANANRAKNSSYSLAIKDKIFVKRNSVFFAKNNVLKKLKNFFVYIANILFFTFKTFSTKKDFSAFAKNLKNIFFNLLLFIPKKILSLNFKSKALLAIVFTALLILLININSQKNKKELSEAENNYSEISSLIEQKQNQAEANILFNNDDGAKKLYDEIKQLMDQLPQKTDEQTKKYSEFEDKYDIFLEKIRRVTRLENLEEIANFSNLSQSANVDNIIFLEKEKKIYAGDSSQKSIYILDTEDKLTTALTNLEQPYSAFLYPTFFNDKEIYYYSNNNQLAKVNITDDKLGAINANFDTAAISDLENFNNNLYALDSGAKQIYRYTISNSVISTPYSWIQGEADFEKAIDFTIDGSVYLLVENGRVIKYLRGTKQDFALKSVEPELKNPTKIFTSKDINSIYILEPEESRIVVFDKEGFFLMQYQDKSLKNLKDFIVDEKNKTLYILNDNTVYKHALIHLTK